MRRRIGVVIGLDLDDDAADALEQQRRADQIGRDLVDAAGEEFAGEGEGRGRSFMWKPFYAGCGHVHAA